MRALLALVVLLAAPVASAAAEQVHLGLPMQDASRAHSVLWAEAGPARDDATLVLEGPEGEREVRGRAVEGPSVLVAYEARLDDLAADTTYRYRLDGRAFEFSTPPETPSDERPLRIVALGDMGISARAADTVAVVAGLEPDLVLHAGDISYAEGRENEWVAWFEMVEPVAATIPWVTALGNHETYTGASPWALLDRPSEREMDYYRQHFGLPGNELWYSFDWAGVHVVGLDTFSRPDIAPEQVAWLDEDLAAHADAPWTIVFLHEPPFSSNDHGSSARVQDAFVPLFEAYGVDLVIAGHDHGYERSHPMGGVTYLVTGGGGESLYADWERQPAWSAARASEYHVTVLDVYVDRIEGRPVPTQGGALDDAFVLARDDAPGASAAIVTRDTPALAPVALVATLALFALLRRR